MRGHSTFQSVPPPMHASTWSLTRQVTNNGAATVGVVDVQTPQKIQVGVSATPQKS